MEGSAIVEPESKVEGISKGIMEGGDDSSTPISKFLLIGYEKPPIMEGGVNSRHLRLHRSAASSNAKAIREGGDNSTPISKFLLIIGGDPKPYWRGGVDNFSNISRRTTSLPRLTSPCLVFMEEFFERYVKTKRSKDRTLVDALTTCGEQWAKQTEKGPYRRESAKRMDLYKKKRASLDRLIYHMQPPVEVEEEPVYEILSPFGMFVESELFLAGTRLTSFKTALQKWDCMSSEDKSPFVTAAANRMRMHVLMTIEYFAYLLDKYRNGDDGESTGDPVGTESFEAVTGLLVFLDEFMVECDDEQKELDPKKSGQLLIEEQVQEWDMMTEEEQRPYHAKAELLMTKYDRKVFHSFLRISRRGYQV